VNRRINRQQALAQIEVALKLGVSRRAACGLAGVDPSSLTRWTEHSNAVLQRVQSAEAEAEAAAVQCLAQAIRAGSWRAALALLERRFSSEWRLRIAQDVSVEPPIDIPSLLRLHLVKPSPEVGDEFRDELGGGPVVPVDEPGDL
jgi:hypothetical protein